MRESNRVQQARGQQNMARPKWHVGVFVAVPMLLGQGGGAPSAQAPAVVEADRVRIGLVEWVPRFLELPSAFVVPGGDEAVLVGGAWDYIEISGRLTLVNTVAAATVVVLPGGVLERACGSRLVIRDVPIDTNRDPFQWGNGLVNFGGHVSRCGVKTAVAQLAGDAPAGATTIALTSVPTGWEVGDELLLADMRQIGAVYRGPQPQRESLTIAGISGASIALSAPLAYARLAIRDPDGGVVLGPRVTNLTRATRIESENPGGVRGHTANIGSSSWWDIAGTQYVALGRTRNAARDNTSADLSHIGTNQAGKYADHWHQAGSSLRPRRALGNSYTEGQGIAWALAIHGTHDAVVENNACANFSGSCFVTEDGPEIRNRFRRNIAAFVLGNGKNAETNVRQDCPGCEGSAFWLRGLYNTFEQNEAWNSTVGINVFSKLTTNAPVPSVPGGAPDTAFNADDAVPISFRANVTISNDITGIEFWGTEPFPTEDHFSAHNRSRQVWAAQLGGTEVHLVDPRLIGGAGRRSNCIESSSAYVQALRIDGGELRGCQFGITGGMAGESAVLRNVVFQNVRNVHFPSLAKPLRAVFENVVHVPLHTFPQRYVEYGGGGVWQPRTPVSKYGMYDWYYHQGPKHVIRNWQGTGRDYALAANQQKRSTAAWSTTAQGALTNRFFVPAEGLTMGQAWDQFGMAFGGFAALDSDVVPLEGVTGGGGVETWKVMLGQPRAVLTLPNLLEPAAVVTISGRPGIELFLMLTGIGGVATDVAWLSIDGGLPQAVKQGRGGDLRRFVSRVVSPGTHTVETWRQDAAGNRVGQTLVFAYRVQ
jgi:hypothetical protein